MTVPPGASRRVSLLFVTLCCSCTAAIDQGTMVGPTAGGAGDTSGSPGKAGNGGPAVGGTGVSLGAGGGSAGSSGPLSCAPVAGRRLMRLTTTQVVNSLRAIIGAAAADPLVSAFNLPDPSGRAFPPLSATEEGTYVTEGIWEKSESIGRSAAKYVFDHYVDVTGCALSATTDSCPQTYIGTLAERAFRRPVTTSERDSLLQVYTESKALGASVPEALQQAVWAVFTSPHFLYRRELGDPVAGSAPAAGTPLNPYEVASQLAFFLTDNPPDAALLDAARKGTLASADGVRADATRLLALPAVQVNLQQAMFSYFGIGNLQSVVIDPAKVPEYTVGMQNAMLRESQDFLNSVLWQGKLDDLILSRITVVNPDLAKIYGVPFPSTATQTASTFVSVQLPSTRAGLLTQAGFLTSRARTDTGSVVARGLMVGSTILCVNNPAAPPAALTDQIAGATAMLAGKTEREKSLYRQMTPPCLACHLGFDPYGLIIENFDLIGRYRTADEQNRPIDATTTLPADAGGGDVTTARQFAEKVTGNGIFAACVARNLMKYALADGNVERADCAVQAVTQKLRGGGDQTFAALLREIAVSPTLALRVNQ